MMTTIRIKRRALTDANDEYRCGTCSSWECVNERTGCGLCHYWARKHGSRMKLAYLKDVACSRYRQELSEEMPCSL